MLDTNKILAWRRAQTGWKPFTPNWWKTLEGWAYTAMIEVIDTKGMDFQFWWERQEHYRRIWKFCRRRYLRSIQPALFAP